MNNLVRDADADHPVEPSDEGAFIPPNAIYASYSIQNLMLARKDYL